jgi:tRNA dimethylallyltransferase
VNEHAIPYHLIDIVPPQEQFYLHQFISKLKTAFEEIRKRKNTPIICGGTGLYLDALRKDFSFTQIPEDDALRRDLHLLSKPELLPRLAGYRPSLTKHIDLNSKKRIIRGIEIAEYIKQHGEINKQVMHDFLPFYIGVDSDIETRKQRISKRLSHRLENGLIEEVAGLLNRGLSKERLQLFGLEYKFVLQFIENKISKDELFFGLQTAIYQFAKRQMTWFRKMEKEGVKIHWVERVDDVPSIISNFELKNLVV